jgi:plastocyanin
MRKSTDRSVYRLGHSRWLGLVSIGALAALALALSACGSSNGASSANASGGGGTKAQSAENVKLVVKTDAEHGKKGPDGKWHDAFLPADFSVKAGDVVHVTVYNYDSSPHSFNSSELGANATILAGSETKPSKTTFTFHAPQKAGSYDWYCAMPCDPWAMAHDGYMKGRVTVI